MSQRHQTGHLRRARRKSGPHVWESLWRETDERGRRVHRTAIVGTVEQYPTEELAWTAANGLRVYLNGSRNHYSAKPIPIRDLIDHYGIPISPRTLAGTLTRQGRSTSIFWTGGFDLTGAR